MGVNLESDPDLDAAELVIDAPIGYGLRGDLRQPVAGWISKANGSSSPTLALDVPSGLDATSGTPGRSCIEADATLTLALPKSGLLADQAAGYVGELNLADISVPPALYQQLGIDLPNLFAAGSILRVS